MEFHWTKETAFKGYACRDSRGYTRAIVTGSHGTFFGQLLQPNLPSGGPYATAEEAAGWVTEGLVETGAVPPDSMFGMLPGLVCA